jgi:hypothetical protein
MRNLIAAIYFVLALFGCESGGTTTVTRSIVDGVDVVHSRTRVLAGIARFECISSATGECHYALFPSKCASADRDCAKRPIDRFTLPKGDRREVVGLPSFDACVAQDDAAMQRECVAARPAAAARQVRQ